MDKDKRIKELQAEVIAHMEAKSEAVRIRDRVNVTLRTENARLREDLGETSTLAEGHIAALRSSRDRLREALEPFVDTFEMIDPLIQQHFQWAQEHGHHPPPLQYALLQMQAENARVALSPKNKEVLSG